MKMDLHFFALFLHFLCILIFGGPFFSCICFAFFCIYIFFYVSQAEAQPDHTSIAGTWLGQQALQEPARRITGPGATIDPREVTQPSKYVAPSRTQCRETLLHAEGRPPSGQLIQPFPESFSRLLAKARSSDPCDALPKLVGTK